MGGHRGSWRRPQHRPWAAVAGRACLRLPGRFRKAGGAGLRGLQSRDGVESVAAGKAQRGRAAHGRHTACGKPRPGAGQILEQGEGLRAHTVDSGLKELGGHVKLDEGLGHKMALSE